MDYRCIWLLCMACSINGAKILGIFPTPAYSHQMVYQTIMKALAARGHNITVISTDPLKEPIENYTDIDMSFTYKIHQAVHDFESMESMTPYEFVSLQSDFLPDLADYQLSSPQLQEFRRSNHGIYDLVFLEGLLYQSYHGLIHQLGSPPVIGIFPVEFLHLPENSCALPIIPSYMPNFMLTYSDKMTFFERLHNFFFSTWMRYRLYSSLSKQEEIMRKHFGEVPPSTMEADKNMSLVMLSSDWVFNYPIPLPPAVVTFHGVHIKHIPDPLPVDLQVFLDKATNGVIFFSFGSNVHSCRMPNHKIQAFVEAFSELPLQVLWKWESDVLPDQRSENIKFVKWLPQQDILAHPNIKLFISHCGALSIQEAVYHAVPLLGIPFFGDQKYNARKVDVTNIGIYLPFKQTTKETLLFSINRILKEPSFRNNMKKLSSICKDQPETSLEKAVWWAEYVLRHKGAKHLRSAALDLEWYQCSLLDVLAVIVLIVLVTIFIFYYILKTIYSITRGFITKFKYD